MAYNVALVGATGKVGEVMLQLLIQRNFPIDSIRLMASNRSAGRQIQFKDMQIEVEDAGQSSFAGIDFAIFSAGAKISRELSPKASDAGAIVIDNSSAWRMDPDVPLVVSEVNPHALENIPKGIVANPNCTTMVGMLALKPLHQAAGLKRLIVSTYQAVSGMGYAGVQEFYNQLEDIMKSKNGNKAESKAAESKAEIFDAPIALNVIPKCGDFSSDSPFSSDDPDETIEEQKLTNETRKILEIPDLPVSATCVRVGVETGHSLSINAEFENPLSPEEARKILAAAEGISLKEVPTPLQSADTDDIVAGRIRKDTTVQNGLSLFVVGDNLRKGAALNAIQIAELLAQR